MATWFPLGGPQGHRRPLTRSRDAFLEGTAPALGQAVWVLLAWTPCGSLNLYSLCWDSILFVFAFVYAKLTVSPPLR